MLNMLLIYCFFTGGARMDEMIPEWITNLEDEELVFIKKLVLSSGSLKEVSKLYNVTYPTVRLRLDRIIQKIKLYDKEQNEPFISLVKTLALNEKVSLDTAKILINEYKKNITEDI